MVHLTIDHKPVEVPEGTTILAAAKSIGIDIPTLCFLKDINEAGDCRMCLVEVKGQRGFATSCIQKVEEGMDVLTNSIDVIEARRTILDLILSNHHRDCLTCVRNGHCELSDLARKFNVQHIEYEGEMTTHTVDDHSPSLIRDFNKCILCRRCVSTCNRIQGIGAIDCINRGFHSTISTTYDLSLNDVNCTFCGQCITACPTGALREKESIKDVWAALNDSETVCIAQTAPAVRVALGELFGQKIGTNVTGQMVSAIKHLGFDYVFDTNTGADMTIMEEAHEFIERLNHHGVLPMMTSCSPAWIRYAEKNYPELLDHISSCKSPQMMFGAMIKSYFAQTKGIDPEKIKVVSIMPCVAKKAEILRPEMEVNGLRDVDFVLTTRELGRMIDYANIDFNELPDADFDDPLPLASGAGAIFGTSGGVMEAALRTAADWISGETLQKLDYSAVRGMEKIKEASVTINGQTIKVAVASSLKSAATIMDSIKNGTCDYHFVEIMSCPGGCIMGGGQPIKNSKTQSSIDIAKRRSAALYDIDQASTIRKSHENPVVKDMYENFFGQPGSEVAHHYLHTHYHMHPKYNIPEDTQ